MQRNRSYFLIYLENQPMYIIYFEKLLTKMYVISVVKRNISLNSGSGGVILDADSSRIS